MTHDTSYEASFVPSTSLDKLDKQHQSDPSQFIKVGSGPSFILDLGSRHVKKVKNTSATANLLKTAARWQHGSMEAS